MKKNILFLILFIFISLIFIIITDKPICLFYIFVCINLLKIKYGFSYKKLFTKFLRIMVIAMIFSITSYFFGYNSEIWYLSGIKFIIFFYAAKIVNVSLTDKEINSFIFNIINRLPIEQKNKFNITNILCISYNIINKLVYNIKFKIKNFKPENLINNITDFINETENLVLNTDINNIDYNINLQKLNLKYYFILIIYFSGFIINEYFM
jgi:hypothetical protein